MASRKERKLCIWYKIKKKLRKGKMDHLLGLKHFLEASDLGHLYQHFSDMGMELKYLLLANDSDLKEIVSNCIVDKIKLRNAIEIYRKSKTQSNSPTSNVQLQHSRVTDSKEPLLLDQIFSQLETDGTHPLSAAGIASEPSENSPHKSEVTLHPSDVPEGGSSNQLDCSESSISTLMVADADKQNSLAEWIEEWQLVKEVGPLEDKKSLKALLECTTFGKTLLEKQGLPLTPRDRKALVQLIVEHQLRILPSIKDTIRQEVWTNWAKEIWLGIWLGIDNFNLFSQVGFDIMHDWPEGVMKYIMSSLLVALIDECKLFTIELVNNKISAFDFGPDKGDAPVTLSMDHLRNGNIRLAASEMMTFTRYFGIMYGELVPRNNKYLAIYTQLMFVLDIVMSEAFFSKKLKYFEYMIATLCEMYTSLFNKNITPKFHNLVHYPSSLLRFGPLCHLSSMRFEAKHRPNKLASKSSNNRRNMTLTIARRHQLKLNDLFLGKHINCNFTYGVQTNVRETEAHVLAQELGWSDVSRIKKVSWAAAHSARYKENSAIVIKVESDYVHFALICSIYLYDNSKLAFKAQKLDTIMFDDHFYAYKVKLHDYLDDSLAVYIKYEDLQHRYPCNLVVIGYVTPPEAYVVLRKPL